MWMILCLYFCLMRERLMRERSIKTQPLYLPDEFSLLSRSRCKVVVFSEGRMVMRDRTRRHVYLRCHILPAVVFLVNRQREPSYMAHWLICHWPRFHLMSRVQAGNRTSDPASPYHGTMVCILKYRLMDYESCALMRTGVLNSRDWNSAFDRRMRIYSTEVKNSYLEIRFTGLKEWSAQLRYG